LIALPRLRGKPIRRNHVKLTDHQTNLAEKLDEEARYIFRDELLLERALSISSTVGYVHLMFFNLEYLELVKSWICNMRLVDRAIIGSTLFLTSSEVAARQFHAFEPGAHVHWHSYPHSDEFSTGTDSYFRHMLETLSVQKLLIHKGISVLVVEPDSTWFSSTTKHAKFS
jgi:hypothetical protein